ncbi:glycoside hydrolase family 20 protein [Lophiostoma macrostomum CBS 122681]|uniref:Beta-hexosaminidase n=1 Tax=Lophiostoma macrostomum CBS 122681 TaxID=1314788 RepID=A0A6A6SNE4_9PLEO|nr:glycoside hydrolase family 20 protein [Lophiostoma macrostomum CBS 122681]
MRSFLFLSFFTPSATAIWPIPVSYSSGNSVQFISEDVSFNWAGASNVGYVAFQNSPSSNSGYQSKLQRRYNANDKDWWARDDAPSADNESAGVTGDDIVDHAIKQAHNTIFKKGFVPWKFHPRGWEEPVQDQATSISCINLELLQADPDKVAKPLAGSVDESYTLSLTGDGHATITANSSVGLARGLNTFTQLFYKHSQDGVAYTLLAPVEIYDAPKFEHRGINLDVARNWIPVEDIKRTINAVAYSKMNRFHLHVTDAQSWPLEIPALPDLAAKGAYGPNMIYTVDDFAEIQKHAAVQGVELITEIDMPGHTSSVHYSGPDLIAAFNVQPDWNTYCAEPPCGSLKLNSSAVDDFLDTLMSDLLPRIYPYSAYFHTGGDEVNKNTYTLDDTVRSNDSAVLQPLMQKFIDRNHDQVRSLGLTPIVWEEMLLDWNLTLGDDVIVQSWQSDEAVASIVESGHKALVGNYKYWYLDCGKGQWLNFPQSSASSYWPFEDYCAPFHNWRLIYSKDPLEGVPTDKQHLVIGGEAHMWAEQTDPINLDPSIWPRAAAAAEVLWSGATDAQGLNRSQVDAAPRLSEFRERLVALGVRAEPIQMAFCIMNGTQCSLGTGG